MATIYRYFYVGVSIILALLLMHGVASLTREKRFRRVLLYTAFILGTSAVLDFLGLYVTVPIASFLIVLGAVEIKRSRLLDNKLLAELLFFYFFLSMSGMPSRDPYTYYSVQAYYVISHEPRFYILEISSALVVGLYASIARIYVILGLYAPYILALRAFSILSLVALQDFLEKEIKIRNDVLRFILFLSVPYRLYLVSFGPDYVDRIYALIVIASFRSLLKGDRKTFRLTLSLYILGKQSRAALLLSYATIFLLRVPESIFVVVAVESLIIASKSHPMLIVSYPILVLSLLSYLHARRISISEILGIVGKESLFVLSPALLLLRNFLVFGRPLGASELSLAISLGLAKSRVAEGTKTLYFFSSPPLYLIYILSSLLASYVAIKSISMIHIRSASAVAVNERLSEILRLATQFYIIRSLFSIPLPRQVMFLRILVAISLADYGAVILRVPIVLTRAYVLYVGGLPLKRDIELLLSYIEAYVLLLFFFVLIELFYRLGRLNTKILLASGIIILYLSYQYTLVEPGLYEYKKAIYEDLEETIKKLKASLVSGSILTGITPGYIEAYLLPDFRVYQIFRIYEYPIVGELLKNDSLAELIYYLKVLQVRAFIYPSPHYFKRIYEKTTLFLESDYLLSLLLDSDAFIYGSSYSLAYLILSDLEREVFFSRAVIFKGGYTYEIFGNGFSKFYPFSKGVNTATFLSKKPIVEALVYITVESIEEVTVKLEATIESDGDIYTIRRTFPDIGFKVSQIRIEIELEDGEIKNYYF